MFRYLNVALLVTALCALCAANASAELVFLANGRHLSVKTHHIEGQSIVLVLREGGEITCNQALVASITADEVPDPEPVTERALATVPAPPAPYADLADLIDTISTRHGVDPQLVRAVIEVESAYQPNALSRKGAMGLMQLMPRTARQYAVKNPYDPKANIEAGIKHLKSLLRRFELSVAIAAYNAGVAAVERFGGIPPYQETREYVTRVLGLLRSRQSV